MIMSNDSMIQAWEQLILNHLSEFGQYVKIEQADLVGIFITVYVRKQQVHRISQIEIDTVKTGLGGTLGNKGATGIKFRLDESQVLHLPRLSSCSSTLTYLLGANKSKLVCWRSRTSMTASFTRRLVISITVSSSAT
jgi:hypothetical protein